MAGTALGVTLVHELACFTGRPQPLSSSTLKLAAGGLSSAHSSEAVLSGGATATTAAATTGKGEHSGR